MDVRYLVPEYPVPQATGARSYELGVHVIGHGTQPLVLYPDVLTEGAPLAPLGQEVTVDVYIVPE